MDDRSDLLIELGTEELPPKALIALSAALRDSVAQGLSEARLEFDTVDAYATPRRLALVVRLVATRQPDQEVERRGPPVRIAFDADGAPTRAALAFAKGCGIEVPALEQIETPKGAWLVYRGVEAGQPVEALLGGILEKALDALPTPKRMRWGSGDAEFVRPVHWLVLLLGERVLDIELLGLRAGRTTRGHRFHAPDPIEIASPEAYAGTLHTQGRVLANFAERRKMIRDGVAAAAAAADGTAVMSDALLDEVTALVEWPVPVVGRFDTRFLELPEEVLIATLQEHQRYFPVRGSDGRLLPMFVTVSNLESLDPDEVRAGNERVVRPRLADAAFFWKADGERPLGERVDALGRVVFQTKLGSLADKTARIERLARQIAVGIGADEDEAGRAALLCKTDLLTDMVGEFPGLQGTMGGYYARRDGETEAVAAAIAEQYQPRYAGDALPATPAGRAIAVADKLDTIIGIFAIGARPKGSSDPFALRRQALGVLRILIEGELDLDLVALIRSAADTIPVEVDVDALTGQVYDFMMDRLRAYYADAQAVGRAVEPTVFDAVLAKRPARPWDFDQRVHAVERFMRMDAAEALAAANKRIANILRQAGDLEQETPDADKLAEPAEQALHAKLEALRPDVEALLAERRYAEALEALAALREPVDEFFDAVMVMAEDAELRANRLALLATMRRLFSETADLSHLQIARA